MEWGKLVWVKNVQDIRSCPEIQIKGLAEKSIQSLSPVFRGQSYKTFYTLRQFHKRILKHVKNAMQQTFVCHKVRTLLPMKDFSVGFKLLGNF